MGAIVHSKDDHSLHRRALFMVIAVALAPAAAWAQQAETGVADDAKPLEAKQPKQADASLLDAVIVTAQKRTQALEDVPIAISVIDRETLEKGRSHTLADVQQLVPNFSFDRAGTATLSLRGIGGGGRNIGFDPRVGVYLDGVYVGQSQALNMPLFDIAQVDVLRGPQGYLFGRNTVAGAVNITTEAPSPVFDYRLRAVAGNHDTAEFHGSVTGPLGNSVSGKLSASHESRSGYTRNRFNGSYLDDLNRFSTRGQLRFETSEKLTIDVYGDYSRADENTLVGQPTTGFFDVQIPGLPLPKRQVDFNTTPFIDVTLYGGSTNATYRMDNGHTLTSVTGYRDVAQRRQNDTDYSNKDILHINFNDKFKQFSQELRLGSPDEGRARYVFGLYYLHEDADSARSARIGQDMNAIVPLPAGSPVPFAPVGLAFGLTAGSVVPAIANVKTEDLAVFGAFDYDLVERLTLNLGARYTHETKDIVFNLDGSKSGGFRIATLNNFRDSRSDGSFNPTAGLTFALAEHVNVYAKYASGFKSGGWNIDFLNAGQIATGFDFDTETVDSYEVGLKGVAMDGRLRFDMAAFHNQFDNYQVFQFVALGGGASVLQLRNAAKVETRGVEFSTSFQANRNLRLSGNFGYVDATFDKFPNGGPGGADLSGHELPAPSFTAALTLDYGVALPALAGRLDFYGEYSYRGSFFSGANNDPVLERIGSRNLVNARLGYSHDSGRYGVSLWARNLFNRDFLSTRGRDFLGNQFVQYGEPRAYGLELWHNF